MKNSLHRGPGYRLLAGYQRATYSRRRLAAAAAFGLALASQLPAQAQFPINEAFTGTASSNFTFGAGGTSKPASLTGTTTTPGYLRLTDNTNNQAGYAILNNSFASPQGFSISFEFFSFNGTGGAVAGQTTGADGISVFLVDAAGTDPKVAGQFNVGAFGGSLGYAQKTAASGAVTTDVPGVSKGYLGIGLDEYGNFSNPTEGRIGGPGSVPQAVALRGPGTGITGYSYLTGGAIGFPLSFPASTTEAQATSADYRKAYIFVIPVAGGGYNVTVRIQRGPTTVVTTTYNYPISTPPANLRIGFAGSTGGATNYHEIRNLAIVQAPVAADDRTSTRYDTPVTFNITNNDTGVGTSIAPGTVDLDPSTIFSATSPRETSYTVAGKGTFTVDNSGNVTFTPSGTFSGVVSIPYTVNDLLGSTSNPATLTVTVTGADVATSVSGPASANPGSQVTYTVNTSNIGVLTATNVIPTLQLPANLPIPASVDYTYNSTSGLVTFKQVTLAAGGAFSNSVSFAVPISGTTSIAATSNYTYSTNAAIPDAVAGNNSSTLTTAITGLASIATACANPGQDGPATLPGTAGPNTYYPGVSVATANGASTITVGTPSGSTPVAAGDLVLVMQMQGAVINTTASGDANYGSITSSTAGQYEYATVASVNTANSTITLTKALLNTYTTAPANAASTTNSTNSNQNFQVIRVPQYSSLTINGALTGTAWNSQTKIGGVLALDVAGATTFSGATAGISMTAKGFGGGGGVALTGPAPAGSTPANYATLSGTATVGAHGSKGEGMAGTPRFVYNGTSVLNNGVTNEGYATGSYNLGAPANAGGGAQDLTPATNAGNAGGGGGGNASAGGLGGFGFGNPSTTTGTSAVGGRTAPTTPTTLIMGGGGGAGSTTSTANAALSSGGVGGGIIIVRTGTFSGTATIQANGGAAASAATLAQGGGGGGAGGTILVLATPTTPATSGLGTITASVTGGNGGDAHNVPKGTSYGPGGGGSGGVVYTNGTLAAAPITSGSNGITTDGSPNKTIAFGATAGGAGSATTTIAPANTATIGGAGSCVPMLSVAMSTSTPNVTRTGGTPNPAQYTTLISNTGFTAPATSTTITLNPLFTYNTTSPVLTLTSANGTATTLAASAYTVTGTGTSTPTFSGITIPSGSTLSISFPASIASTAVNGTAYQASGTVSFLDPTRTAATQTVGPGNTFASGGGTVPGTNYAAASSSNEDVTIVTPLPVELTRFAVLAVRQDALLTWSTASEHNNDHFTVERSLTGSGFVAVGTVRSQGNSLRNSDYTFTDPNASRLASSTVYYRLKQVDLDGTATYSPVRTVQFAPTTKASASLYPNPSQGQLVLDLSALAQGRYSVQVLDLTGRVLRTQQAAAQATPLDLSGLPQGAYLVLVQGAGVRQALPLLRN